MNHLTKEIGMYLYKNQPECFSAIAKERRAEASYDIAGISDALSVFIVSPDRVFIGRAGGEVVIADATDPQNVIRLGDYSTGGDINDMYVRDYLLFLATSEPNEEFQAIDISTIADPVFHSSLNFPQSATGIDYKDNLIYVTLRSNDALRIITSNNL